jgi:hypothetical protein
LTTSDSDNVEESIKFDINLFNNTSFGVDGDRTNAIYQVANQLRLRNYIELLKMRDLRYVINEVIQLTDEMRKE